MHQYINTFAYALCVSVCSEKTNSFAATERSFTVKMFTFQFFTLFSSLFYVAFFLGRYSFCLSVYNYRLILVFMSVVFLSGGNMFVLSGQMNFKISNHCHGVCNCLPIHPHLRLRNKLSQETLMEIKAVETLRQARFDFKCFITHEI